MLRPKMSKKSYSANTKPKPKKDSNSSIYTKPKSSKK